MASPYDRLMIARGAGKSVACDLNVGSRRPASCDVPKNVAGMPSLNPYEYLAVGLQAVAAKASGDIQTQSQLAEQEAARKIDAAQTKAADATAKAQEKLARQQERLARQLEARERGDLKREYESRSTFCRAMMHVRALWNPDCARMVAASKE